MSIFWTICHLIVWNLSHCAVLFQRSWCDSFNNMESPTILRTQPSPDHGLQGTSWSDSAPETHLLPLSSYHQLPGCPKFPGLFFASQPLPDTTVTQTFTWVHPTLYLWLGLNFMCSVTSSFSWKTYLRPQPGYLSSFLLTVTLNCILLSFYSHYVSPTRMQFSCVQRVCITHSWNSWCPQRYQI